jgi:hypothetical protein
LGVEGGYAVLQEGYNMLHAGYIAALRENNAFWGCEFIRIFFEKNKINIHTY